MYKLEIMLTIFLLVFILVLSFLIEVTPLVLLLLILSGIIAGVMLFLTIKRVKVYNSILKQGRDILQGNLNRRIHISNTDISSKLIIILNEVTEKLQKEIIKGQETEAARKRLLSNISHDIRTPLTSILGYVEALRDDLAIDQDEREKYLDILVSKAENLKILIDEIFQLARLDANDFELDFQRQDLAEIIRESLINFLPRIKQEGLKTVINLPEEDCIINADCLSVERIIENVLKNSIEYGKDGGFIGVKLSEAKGGYTLCF